VRARRFLQLWDSEEAIFILAAAASEVLDAIVGAPKITIEAAISAFLLASEEATALPVHLVTSSRATLVVSRRTGRALPRPVVSRYALAISRVKMFVFIGVLLPSGAGR